MGPCRMSLACWLALLVLVAMVFRKERQRSPGFMPPNSHEQYDRTDFQEPDPYAEVKPELYDSPPPHRGGTNSSRNNGQSVRFASAPQEEDDIEPPMAYSTGGFASGAFQPSTMAYADPNRPSRTMQMATSYSDPCKLSS